MDFLSSPFRFLGYSPVRTYRIIYTFVLYGSVPCCPTPPLKTSRHFLETPSVRQEQRFDWILVWGNDFRVGWAQLRTNSSKVRVRIILYSFLALSVEIEIVDQQIKLNT